MKEMRSPPDFVGGDDICHRVPVSADCERRIGRTSCGFAVGFLLGKALTDREPLPGPERTWAYAMGSIAGIALVASFVMMFLHYGDRIPQ